MQPVSRLRLQSPLTANPKVTAARSSAGLEPQDRLEPGNSPLELMPSRLPATGVGLGWIQRLLASSMYAGIMFSTVCVGTLAPAVVHAQQATPSAQQSTSLLQSYGLSAEASQAILKDPELVKSLQTLPQPVVQRYQGLNSNQKRVLGQELAGKTRLGLIVVQHREAFVKGTAMGMDAFPRMIDTLQSRVEKGHLTAAEGAPLIEAVEQMRSLTPAQRDSVATVIQLETAKIK